MTHLSSPRQWVAVLGFQPTWVWTQACALVTKSHCTWSHCDVQESCRNTATILSLQYHRLDLKPESKTWKRRRREGEKTGASFHKLKATIPIKWWSWLSWTLTDGATLRPRHDLHTQCITGHDGSPLEKARDNSKNANWIKIPTLWFITTPRTRSLPSAFWRCAQEEPCRPFSFICTCHLLRAYFLPRIHSHRFM